MHLHHRGRAADDDDALGRNHELPKRVQVLEAAEQVCRQADVVGGRRVQERAVVPVRGRLYAQTTAPATGSSRAAPLEDRGHLMMSSRIASAQEPAASKPGWARISEGVESVG